MIYMFVNIMRRMRKVQGDSNHILNDTKQFKRLSYMQI